MTLQTERPYQFSKSRQMWKDVLELVPGGSQITRLPMSDDWPCFFERAAGCRAWDVDGNEFIDFLCGYGPIVLGYASAPVDQAVRNVIETSPQSSTNHPLQLDLARQLINAVPCAEMVRTAKTGTEATTGVARLARHITRRKHIARHGYHGWADLFVDVEDDHGLDRDASAKTHRFDGSAADLERLISKTGQQFAAVFVCPADTRPFTKENFQAIIDIAHQHGALVVFDEIKTGFRLALGGAQERLGVTPDLTTVSKAMGNGYPISAIVGKREYMEEVKNLCFSGTFFAEAIGLAAATATLKELRSNDVAAHLERVGSRLIDGINGICERAKIGARAYPDPVPAMPRFIWTNGSVTDGYAPITEDSHTFFLEELVRYGVFFSGWHVAFVNYAHKDEDIDDALNIFEHAMRKTVTKYGL